MNSRNVSILSSLLLASSMFFGACVGDSSVDEENDAPVIGQVENIDGVDHMEVDDRDAFVAHSPGEVAVTYEDEYGYEEELPEAMCECESQKCVNAWIEKHYGCGICLDAECGGGCVICPDDSL